MGKDKELDTLKLIDYEMYPFLDKNGQNDNNGFQIFTPQFIVDDMIKLIGMDYITNIYKKILEPTSGDGAFTVRILEHRLNKILIENPQDYLVNSLTALSNIYSIEMDKELLIKQRNNIYTMLNFIAKENDILLPNQYKVTAEAIIKDNFVWGESNIRKEHNIHAKSGIIIGWYMPTEIKTVVEVPVIKKINTTNLFGEPDEILISNGQLEQKTRYKYRRNNSNRIKFCTWVINNDLTFIKKVEPVVKGG